MTQKNNAENSFTLHLVLVANIFIEGFYYHGKKYCRNKKVDLC